MWTLLIIFVCATIVKTTADLLDALTRMQVFSSLVYSAGTGPIGVAAGAAHLSHDIVQASHSCVVLAGELHAECGLHVAVHAHDLDSGLVT